ncbi:MAG: alpha/beta fold hydrolase [Gammaproteobacteria bacterium]|nr:alpha/beta fold hydrolase [Gammaproteobacteria bacterium]
METEHSSWIQNLQQNQFNGTNNVRINYAVMLQPSKSPAFILCNGRIESYLKYQELASELYQQGYSVYLIDHRGQGLSERLTIDTHKGHVVDFNDYIKDLATFIKLVVTPNGHQKHLLFGHSMGGTIATRYIQTCQHNIDKLILGNPMLGIVLPLPVSVMSQLVKTIEYYAQKFSSQPSYVLGGKSYREPPFDKNSLTQSAERYQQFRAIYQQYPEVQLGAPTNQWLLQGLLATSQCIEDAAKITIPTLLLQGGADRVVKNSDQDKFAANMTSDLIEVCRIAGARHELFFELDRYRQQALTALLDFAGRD